MSDKVAEKTVKVELLADVWLDDGNGGTVRVTTNTPEMDEFGRVKVDKASRAPITKTEIRDVPFSVAKALVDQGKARVPLIMPE